MDNEGTHGTRSGGFTLKIREDEQSESIFFTAPRRLETKNGE